MRYFSILIILFFSNCNFDKKEIEFSGNWKRVQMTRGLFDDTINYENPIELLSFRSDNLVFYYNNLYQYEFNSDYDSMYLMYFDSVGTGSYVRRFKVEFTDLNTMKFSFIRKLIDTTSLEPFDMIYTTTFKKDLFE
tara:strand:- start:300 stop:707 length:408 start_codon:yes stop_codon:yes gene_type:complete